MKRVLATLGCMGVLLVGGAAPALAQRVENIVVTAQRVERDEHGAAPAITLKARADEVLFEVSLVSGTLDMTERREELRKSFSLIQKAVDARDDLSLDGGDVEESYAIETVSPDDLMSSYGQRGSIDLVLRVRVGTDDTFKAVVDRAEAFARGLKLSGRTQLDVGGEQYLSLDDPRSFRRRLLNDIAVDVKALARLFETGGAGSGVAEVEGLARSIISRPTGPLEIELYIPYQVRILTGESR